MSSLLLSLRGEQTVPAFAAATHQARRMFSSNSNSSRRSSSGKEESESAAVFDEFGAFEQAHGEEELLQVIERQHEENESEDEDAEDDEQTEEQLRRLSEKLRRVAIPTQKNSPGWRGAGVSAFKQAAEQRKKEEPVQKASPKAAPAAQSSKAVGEEKELPADPEHGHTRAATDPLSSAALSRMRYYRKLIPAPKPQNTSPKSQPHAANHVSSTAKSAEETRRFFPPSQSAAAVLYHSNRSLPITIPSKKGSPTNDDSHRFRADIHPRIAADSSFILPAASFLPSALQKSFVPQGREDDEEDRRSSSGLDKHRDSLKAMKTGNSGFEKDDQFGFEFEMDM